LLATATLLIEIVVVMGPAFVQLMDGECTFGASRRQKMDAGGEKVTMWAVSLTWMNTSSLLLLMIKTKVLDRVHSSPRQDSAFVVTCMRVCHSIDVDSVNEHK
jgi:hypothetical protein